MSKEFFTELFEYYAVNDKRGNDRHAMRKRINELLAKTYPSKSSELLQLYLF